MKVLIIGAGILGASTAYHLARKGINVEIVDAKHEGKATLAGAGIVCPWATKLEDGPFYDMYAAGAAYYATLVDALKSFGETDLGYGKVGALVVAEDRQEYDAAAQRIAHRVANVPEAGVVEHLSSAAARAKFPPLRQGMEAIFIPGAARVDARLLAAAMLRAAVSLGAKVGQDRVTLSLREGKPVCIASDGTLREADEIVVTAGAWAPQILASLGLSHPVEPQKGQIIHLRLPGVQTSNWPVLLPMGSHYLLAFDDSRVVIGATREDNAGFDYRVTAGGEAEVLNAGLAVAPGLANATHIETRIGFRPASGNAKPILGRVPGIAGLTLGNGLGAAGLTIGPFAGKLLADFLTDAPLGIDFGVYAPA
ncbi:NAD(P)/FAD-dependent oxidoreductase [Brucella pituitosa]|uniref:NAD(P)/FAD-dependent oxidoreductase n=1 Tax=Brucella pituitosa TaxID=571256 RepID=UPI000CFE7D0E|nr:FAD-dependent oxidoreductase [Ochrobactrum sp. MYb68]